MIFAILCVYGSSFFILGIVFMMAIGPTPWNEKAALSRARYRRARKEKRIKARVHFDPRVKRHSTERSYW